MPSSNPFWFGYYPGDKPLTKRPPKVMPGPVLDFSQVAPEQLAVAMDAYLDEVATGVKDTMLLPKWMHDQVISDWKKSFTASAIGYVPSGSSTFEFEGPEGADIPGVQVSINLYDLVKNPQKTLQKFVDKQILSGIDPRRSEFWTDLDSALSKRLYKDVVKGKGGKLTQFALSTANEDPISFKDQKVYAKAKVYESDEAGLGRLRDNETEWTEGENDVYEAVGKAFTGFVMNKKTTAKRGREYTKLQTAFIKAAATELEQRKDQIIDRANMGGTIGGGAIPEGVIVGRLVDTFLDESKVVENLGEFNTRLTASFGVAGSLSKKAFTGLQWDSRYVNADAAKAAGDKAAQASILQIQAIKKSAEALRKEIGNTRSSIEAYRTNIKPIATGTANGIMSPEVKRYNEKLADFNRRVAPIEDVFRRAEHLCDRIDGVAQGKGVSRVELESLIREQTAVATRMSHQRYGGGVYNQYVVAVSREYFERDNFGRNKYFDRTVMSQGFNSLDPIYRYSKGQYLREDGGDLIEAVIAGKYFERRYWYGRWRNTIQAFTPSYWTTKVLKRIGYFGLVYDEDDELNLFLNPKDPDTDEDIHNFKHAMGRVVRPFTRYHHFNASLDVTYAGQKLKSKGRFEGGAYLNHLNAAWVRTDPANKAKLVGIVDASGTWTRVGTLDEQKQALIYLINGDTVGFENATGLKYQMSGLAGSLAFNNATKKGAVLFRKKVLKNKKLVKSLGFELDATGNLLDNDKNKAILDGLFTKLGEMDRSSAGIISPFIPKVGLFNWMSAKLTRVQYFEAKLLAPFLKPLVLLRESIKNLAGKAFRTVLYAILGTATGGVGAFLMKTLGPFLEKVFNATLARFMKYFTDGISKAFKALIKGNIDAMFDALAEEAAKMMAWALACGCSIPIFLILMVFLIMTPIISAIPPTDRSKARSSTSTSGTTLPPEPAFTGSSCVLKNTRLTLGSYNPTNNTGHGSRYYWSTVQPRSCPSPASNYVAGTTVFSIPFMTPSGNNFRCSGLSCSPSDNGPADMSVQCKDLSRTTNFYGFAADYMGDGGAYAPGEMCGRKIQGSWRIDGSYRLSNTSTQCGVLMRATDEDGKLLKMTIMHLDTCPPAGNRAPGDFIAPLYASGTPHVHIELIKDGLSVKPESCDCI